MRTYGCSQINHTILHSCVKGMQLNRRIHEEIRLFPAATRRSEAGRVLSQQILDNVTVNISQSEVAALAAECEAFVVNA